MSVIIIDNLATARFEAGKVYELAARDHVITGTISLPDNVTVYADQATIIYEGSNPPVWSAFKKRNVAIVGGTYKLGLQNYVAFLEHGSNYVLKYATVIAEPKPGQFSGGLAIVRGSKNVFIYSCHASTINRYFIFMEAGNDGVLVEGCSLTRGSIQEAGIRIMGSKNVTLCKNMIWCDIPGAKNSALRMQDGENFQVIDGNYHGGFGAGPLADGDGGRMWGISRWYLTNGKTVDSPTQPPDVDLERTMKKREEMIGHRMKGVLVRYATIDGPITLEAGLENYRHIGGAVKAPQIFTGITWRYPETDEWTKPDDIVRPQAHGAMMDVSIDGEVKDNPIELIGCRHKYESLNLAAVKK